MAMKRYKRDHTGAFESIYLRKAHIPEIFEQVDDICYSSCLNQSFSFKNAIDQMFFSIVLEASSSPSEWMELLGSQKSPCTGGSLKELLIILKRTFEDKYLNYFVKNSPRQISQSATWSQISGDTAAFTLSKQSVFAAWSAPKIQK